MARSTPSSRISDKDARHAPRARQGIEPNTSWPPAGGAGRGARRSDERAPPRVRGAARVRSTNAHGLDWFAPRCGRACASAVPEAKLTTVGTGLRKERRQARRAEQCRAGMHHHWVRPFARRSVSRRARDESPTPHTSDGSACASRLLEERWQRGHADGDDVGMAPRGSACTTGARCSWRPTRELSPMRCTRPRRRGAPSARLRSAGTPILASTTRPRACAIACGGR